MIDDLVPTRWHIPEEVLSLSLTEMAWDGAYGNEGIAMWLGQRVGQLARVTHVVRLRGHGIRKRPALLTISAGLMNELTDVAIEQKRSLIGQIHSHGSLYGVNLSETDKLYGVAFPGYLSIVAPHYAQDQSTTFGDCGVHLFAPPRGWTRLTSLEVSQDIVVERGGPSVPLLSVGE